MEGAISCPICTLYLREGITLEAHLNTHPKEQVISALIRTIGQPVPNPSEPNMTVISQQSIVQSPPNFANIAPNSIIKTVRPAAENMTRILPTIFPQPTAENPTNYVTMSGNPIMQFPNMTTLTIKPISQLMNPELIASTFQQVNTNRTVPELVQFSRPPSIQLAVNRPVQVQKPSFQPIFSNTNGIPEFMQIPSNGFTCQPVSYSPQFQNMFLNTTVVTPVTKTYSRMKQPVQNVSVAESSTCTTDSNASSFQYSVNAMFTQEKPLVATLNGQSNINLNQETNPQLEEGIFLYEEQIEDPGPPPEFSGHDVVHPESSHSELQELQVRKLDSEIAEEWGDDVEAVTVENTDSSSALSVSKDEKSYSPDEDSYGTADYESTCQGDIVSHSFKNDHNYLDVEQLKTFFSDKESVAREASPSSLNIRADEIMPTKGELSEQESQAADNSNWSDFVEAPPIPQIYKCSQCDQSFSCPKERRVHKNSTHDNAENKPKKKVFKCVACNEVFTSLKLKRQHQCSSIHCQVLPCTSQPELKLVPENSSAVKTEGVKQETSTDIKPLKFLCPMCKSTVSSIEEFSDHMRLVHEKEGNVVVHCPNCKMSTANMELLKSHLPQCPSKGKDAKPRLRCVTCKLVFMTDSQYTEHLKSHPLACAQCNKVFYHKHSLNLHMRWHLEVKPFECLYCTRTFITRQKLEEHMNGHSGAKPIKCPLCDKRFSRHSNLIQHRNIHHIKGKKKVKDFVCRCGDVFHSQSKLDWHKEIHETKPKTCKYCSQKFIHMTSLTRHIRKMHMPKYLPDEERHKDNVKCWVCSKFYVRSSLKVHLRRHSDYRPFPCNICNKSFATKWNLQLHLWTHQSRSNMPFKCVQCKAAFFRQSDLVVHMNGHKNVKPYTCNICGQKFIRKYNCLRHQREHSDDKKYLCCECGKEFHRSYYLKDHMRVHNGVRPYSCHVCGKASSTKSNHNKHVRIHDTREPVNTEN